MNNEELLKAVIKKYELEDPVPSEVRLSMEKSRRESLSKILKRNAGTAVFTSAVVTFFMWTKKFGISFSIAKSAVAVTAAAAIGAGAVAAAGIYGTVKIGEYLLSPGVNSETGKLTEPNQQVTPGEDSDTSPQIATYTLAVSQVEMDNASGTVLSGYTDAVIRELRRINGPRAAVAFDMLDSYHRADRILSISIIKLDEKSRSFYRISAKIISSADSRVLKHISETVDTEGDVSGALRSLAVKVSSGK